MFIIPIGPPVEPSWNEYGLPNRHEIEKLKMLPWHSYKKYTKHNTKVTTKRQREQKSTIMGFVMIQCQNSACMSLANSRK